MTPGNGPPGNTPPSWRDMRDQRRIDRAQWRMQRRMQGRACGRGNFGGVILLVFGAVFLLNNLGLFDIREIRDYWPVLLIGFGLFSAVTPRHGVRSLVWSGLLIVMGGLLLLQNFGYIRGNVWEIIWPLWLIFLGLSFLLRGYWGGPGFTGPFPWTQGGPAGSSSGTAGFGGSAFGSSSSTANRLNESNVFGGIKHRVDSQEFEGGYLSSVFGGIEIDLRGANTKLDELFIQADAVFGGIEIFLPDRWNVTVKGSGVFGGFEDRTHSPFANTGDKRPHVTVTGSAVFGGVTIRN